mgnify:CR=1 FL=1
MEKNILKALEVLPKKTKENILYRLAEKEKEAITNAFDEMYFEMEKLKKDMLNLLATKKKQGLISSKISLQNILELPPEKPKYAKYYIQNKMGEQSYTSISMRARYDERKKVI